MFPSIFVPTANGLVQRKLPVTRIEREVCLNPANPPASGFSLGYGSGLTTLAVVQNSVASSADSLCALFPIENPGDPMWTLVELRASVRGRIVGAPAHSVLPDRMPRIDLLQIQPNDALSVALTGTDQSPNVATYDGWHSIATNSRSPVTHTSDALIGLHPGNQGSGTLQLPSTQYWCRILGEYGGSAQADSFGIVKIWTVWQYA